MKITKTTLSLIGLSASFFVAGVLTAQSPSTKAAAPATTEKQQKLFKVCSLTSVEANTDFQRNVQVMQAMKQNAIELNNAADKETNAAKKKEARAKADDALKVLNENNQKMFKTYGFSLDRNYTLVVETAHVYMFVTDEEAAKLEKEAAAAAKAAPAASTKK